MNTASTPTTDRKRSFSLDVDTVEVLDRLPQSRSVLLGEALDNAYANPSHLANALARRARHDLPAAGRKSYTITTPPGFMDKLNALSEQMGLSMDLTLRLAAEALLVEKGVWEP